MVEEEEEVRHLQVRNHFVGAGLQVDAADGHVLAAGPVAGQVHRHQVVQATPCWWREERGGQRQEAPRTCCDLVRVPAGTYQ